MKIKNWKKVSEGSYQNTTELKKIPYGGSEHRPNLDIIYRQGKTYPFKKGWEVSSKGKSGYIRFKIFKTKQEALDYAMNYMKVNPNG